MSVFIDSQYVSQLSPILRNFKKKRNDLWNFSCPFCGDSKKDTRKARGFIYKRGNQLFYKCYNCPSSCNFPNFLKFIDEAMYDSYIAERYITNDVTNIKNKEIARVMDFQQPVFGKRKEILLGLDSIAGLPDEHPAKQYIMNRQIPRELWRELFWTEDFREVAMRFDEKYEKLRKKDARIVIPFIDDNDKVTAIQGRTLNPDEKIRYITVKASEASTKVFGLDKVNRTNTILVVEGLFDSMLLPNSLAAACADLSCVESFVPKKKCILIPDREPRNKDLGRQIQKFIKDEWRVCLLPDSLKSKDINDYILKDGKTVEELLELIRDHTYSGLELEFEFSNWRKI